MIAFVPHNDTFRYDADDLVTFFGTNRVDTLLLINPDNPSGNFISMDGVHKLASWCEDNDIRFILDESFVESISKSYGVPGLRLGILCSADTNLVSKLKKQVSIWNINSFAEFFMQIYPKYREDYTLACKQFIQAREDFERELKKIPFIKVMPSQANYFFLEVLPPYKPIELCALLLEKYNILASACLAKKGIKPNKYMRIAIRNHGDNDKFIQAMKDLVK